MTDVTRVLLPMMLKLGIATAEAIDIETLKHRLHEEVAKQRGTAMGIVFMNAWIRKG